MAREVTAIFGGTFDPPHLGHREAVIALFKNPEVKDVRVLPSGNPVLKTAQTPAEHRLAMAKLNFSALPEGLSARVKVDDLELKRSRETPSYTFETLLELRKEGTPLAFVLGVDQVESLDQWHRFPEVLGLCDWIALERQPDGADRMGRAIQRLVALGALATTQDPRVFTTTSPSGSKTEFKTIPTPARAVSSTEIRRGFAKNAENTADLLPEVRAYLNAHHLYGT